MTIDPPVSPVDPPVSEGEAPLPEQPETDLAPQSAAEFAAPAETSPASAEAAPTDPAARRTQLAQEIRSSRRLPRGLRERLAQAVESLPPADGAAVPSLRVTDALALLEESLPPQLVLAAETLEPTEHPAGEGFFSGDPRRISAAEAARIAAEQLAATGFAGKMKG